MISFLRSSIATIYSLSAFLFLLFLTISGIQNGFSFPIISTVFSAGIVILLFVIIMRMPKLTTNRHLLIYALPLLLSFILCLIYVFQNTGNYLVPLLMNGTLLVGWLLYNYVYSTYPNRNHALQVANMLPNFSLEDVEGNSVNAFSFLGNPAVFLFYRGNWCPLCMLQIEQLATQYQQIKATGAQVVLISPQPHSFTKKLAEKHQLDFHYLVDVDNQVAKQLGIFHPNGLPLGLQIQGYQNDTVMPTLLITDASGRIVFVDLTDNYRLRPEPSTILNILKEKVKVV